MEENRCQPSLPWGRAFTLLITWACSSTRLPLKIKPTASDFQYEKKIKGELRLPLFYSHGDSTALKFWRPVNTGLRRRNTKHGEWRVNFWRSSWKLDKLISRSRWPRRLVSYSWVMKNIQEDWPWTKKTKTFILMVGRHSNYSTSIYQTPQSNLNFFRIKRCRSLVTWLQVHRDPATTEASGVPRRSYA